MIERNAAQIAEIFVHCPQGDDKSHFVSSFCSKRVR